MNFIENLEPLKKELDIFIKDVSNNEIHSVNYANLLIRIGKQVKYISEYLIRRLDDRK